MSTLNRSAQAGMGSGVEGRVPAAPGPGPSAEAPIGSSSQATAVPSRGPADVVGVPFREIFPRAYGWITDDDGYLWGLVAGDMGYDKTDTKLTDLLDKAASAEWDRYYDTHEPNWPVHNGTLDFTKILFDATAPASGTDARSAETRSGSVEDEGPVGEAETPSQSPNPLSQTVAPSTEEKE